MFSRLGVCVGGADRRAAARDFRTVTVGAENVVTIRGDDRRLGAFLNVCRHRGARICRGETTRARGDWHVCEWVQAGVRSPALQAGGVFVPIERKIRGFKDYVLEQLGPTEGAAGSEG